MFTFMPSFPWYTTREVYYNRAAGREAAPIPGLDTASLGSNTLSVPQRFSPSAAWRVTCCAYV